MVMHGKTIRKSAKDEGFRVKKHAPYKREKKAKMLKQIDEDSWYAVFQRWDSWWFTDLYDPLRREHGPFASSDEAHEGAFRYSQHDGA